MRPVRKDRALHVPVVPLEYSQPHTYMRPPMSDDGAVIAFTVKDACRLSGLGRSTLYELVRAGEVKASKIGRRTLIDADSLRQAIARHRVPALILPPQLATKH